MDPAPDPAADPGPDLTVVILGNSGVGKSASGNTILGQAAFVSKQSFGSVTKDISKQTETVFGKRISVIDTPGILGYEKRIQAQCQELLQSSGPRLFLVVVKVDRFTIEEKNAVDAALRVIGKDGFHNCYLLFTGGDNLRNMPLDELMKDDPECPLPKLFRRFEGRHHVFNNENGGLEQVRQLLLKSGHLVDGGEEERGNDMQQRTVSRIRTRVGCGEDSASVYGAPALSTTPPRSPVDCPTKVRRMVLLGLPGVGKSSSGNTILGSDQFSEGCDFNAVSTVAVSKSATVEGCQVTVVDTPGFTDQVLSPRELFDEIMKSVQQADPGPHAFIIVVRLGRILDIDIKMFELLQKLFGSDALKYAMVLFTHGDDLRGKSITELIQSNRHMSDLVSKCGGRYCVFDNRNIGNRVQVKDLLDKIDQMVTGNDGEHCTSNMLEHYTSNMLEHYTSNMLEHCTSNMLEHCTSNMLEETKTSIKTQIWRAIRDWFMKFLQEIRRATQQLWNIVRGRGSDTESTLKLIPRVASS